MAARAAAEVAITRAVEAAGEAADGTALPAPMSWLAHAPTDAAIAEALFAPVGGAQGVGGAQPGAATPMGFVRALAREGSRAAVVALLEAEGGLLTQRLADAVWSAVQ